MRASWLNAPEILPDELDYSYLGALLRFNGIKPPNNVDKANPILASFSTALEPQSAWQTYISLASISGQTEEAFLKHHSLLPWRDALARRQFSNPKFGVRYRAERKMSIRLIRSGAAWCPECAREDVKFHGRAYWRRRHQLPGVMHCDVHDVMLASEAGKAAFLKSPSFFSGDAMAVTSAGTLSDAEKLYADLLYQIGANSIHLDELTLAARLEKNVGRMGESIHRRSEWFAQLISTCSPAFLEEAIPTSKKSCQTLTDFLSSTVPRKFLSSLPPYLLLLVLTESSGDDLWSFFQNQARRRPVAKVNETSLCKLTTLDVLSAYIAEEGNHTRTAQRLQVQTETIRARLLTMGLPAMGKREFMSARAFLIDGRSFEESVSSSGLDATKFENLVRAMANPFAEVLFAMIERYPKARGSEAGIEEIATRLASR